MRPLASSADRMRNRTGTIAKLTLPPRPNTSNPTTTLSLRLLSSYNYTRSTRHPLRSNNIYYGYRKTRALRPRRRPGQHGVGGCQEVERLQVRSRPISDSFRRTSLTTRAPHRVETEKISDPTLRSVADNYLGFGERLFEFFQGTAVNSDYFKRDSSR